MAFLKGEITNLEYIYLNKIGVKNMFGKPITKFSEVFVVDRENNYFLVSQVHTNISRDGREIIFIK